MDNRRIDVGSIYIFLFCLGGSKSNRIARLIDSWICSRTCPIGAHPAKASPTPASSQIGSKTGPHPSPEQTVSVTQPVPPHFGTRRYTLLPAQCHSPELGNSKTNHSPSKSPFHCHHAICLFHQQCHPLLPLPKPPKPPAKRPPKITIKPMLLVHLP